MAKLVGIIFTLFAALLFLAASTNTVSAQHQEKREDSFENYANVLRSKGGRMRFGKRGYNAPQQETPFLYYFAMPEAGPAI